MVETLIKQIYFKSLLLGRVRVYNGILVHWYESTIVKYVIIKCTIAYGTIRMWHGVSTTF